MEVDESHRPVLKFLANDPFRRKSEPIAIKAQGSLEIVDANGNHGDLWLHALRSPDA
jgi:hypothetical protein